MNVFVCSPYSGLEENYYRAIDYCRYEIESGNAPFAPHVIYHDVLDEETERDDGIQCGICWLERSDELHVWGDRITSGMAQEIMYAESINIPVVYMGEPCG